MKAVGRCHQAIPWRKVGIRGPGGSAMSLDYTDRLARSVMLVTLMSSRYVDSRAAWRAGVPARLERIRREWRKRLAGLAFDEDSIGLADDADQETEWSSLDSYLIGEYWLHVHLREFRFGAGRERRDVCLTAAERLVGSRLLPIDGHALGYADALMLDGARNGGEFPMLVAVREHPELFEHGLGGSVRGCAIGLRLLDGCPYRLGNPLEHPAAQDLELAGVGKDRKPCSAARSFDRGPDDVIERGAEVLDGLAREQRPFIRWRLPLDCEAAIFDLARRSRFDLYAEHVGVSVLEGVGFPAQSLDLFYAPHELAFG